MIAITRVTILAVLLASWLQPAAAQVSTNGSNTFVRFHFYHGVVPLGDVDVELFTTDKPVTVSNFMRYVRSGAYDNIMLYRCEQGTNIHVIQGGGIRSLNPLSSAYLAVSGLAGTPQFGRITNEFGVGAQLSNTFGTLAMARQAGNEELPDLGTNSAQSDWFFNTIDNSARLDTNYGGFTVFGRAVAGTNVLDFFNRTSASLGVLPLGGIFNQLPVAYADGRFPRYNEIYHVRITELGVTDTTRPTITVASPAQNARLTNANLTMTGTAVDDGQISSLWYRTVHYEWKNYNGFLGSEVVYGDEINVPASNSWALPLNLAPGTNFILVQSVDSSGLRSAEIRYRSVFYSVPYPIALTNIGSGKITGATNGQRLEIGKFYNLKAVPALNHMFVGWSGRYQGDLPSARVPMESNLVLNATFVTNPFAPLKATYSGLFFNPTLRTNPANILLAPIASGGITFSVTDRGKISGKLRMAAQTLSFSGACHPLGYFSKIFNRPGDVLVVNLVLDVTNRSDYVTGDVNDPVNGLNQLIFLSEVHAYRVRPGTTAAPSAYAGKHTFMIPGTNGIGLPFGDSWATATVSASGTMSVSGSLADNTPFTFSGPILANGVTNGLLPFYTAHNSGRSSAFGWVQFDYAATNDDFHGQMHWFKKAPNPAKPYADGFQGYFPVLTGSRYTPATSTNQVLGFSNAVVILSGGHLSTPSTNEVFLRTNNSVLNLDTNKLTLTISKSSGQFIGTVTPVDNAKSIPFKGTLLKKQDCGVGFFVSTNVTGQVYFGQ